MTTNGPMVFRRRPEEITALQWTGGEGRASAIAEFTRRQVTVGEGNYPHLVVAGTDVLCNVELAMGDWITTRQDGDFCRVPAGIFDRLFEAVELDPRP
ncbi:hypothetical protein KGO5_01725 [Sinorhizobium sp. KGO-5]|uniref:hypothetical protein n=1 Tax=Sinorhizobium sp. KGO-5 TaxID=1470810 RepID=UPI0029497852|nr:hypothetical protein KGO5_01725 [Sinorhizobium sp. KGO-5]